MEEARKIKGLRSQAKIMKGDLDTLKFDLGTKQREYTAKLHSLKDLNAKIESFEKKQEPSVSEHAIVRYLERIKGYDIAEIEKEILSEEVLELVEKLGGTGGYPNGEFKVLMKNYTVTTVI